MKKKIKKIELAEQNKTKEYDKEIYLILKALGHPEALVTDESCISDFLDIFNQNRRQIQIKKFERKIGIKIQGDEYLWMVAEKIRNEKTS